MAVTIWDNSFASDPWRAEWLFNDMINEADPILADGPDGVHYCAHVSNGADANMNIRYQYFNGIIGGYFDASNGDSITFWWYGQNSGITLSFLLLDKNVVEMVTDFKDNFTGWKQLKYFKTNFQVEGEGTFDWSNLWIIGFYEETELEEEIDWRFALMQTATRLPLTIWDDATSGASDWLSISSGTVVVSFSDTGTPDYIHTSLQFCASGSGHFDVIDESISADASGSDTIEFWWCGYNTGKTIEFILAVSEIGGCDVWYDFTDNFWGWKKFSVLKSAFRTDFAWADKYWAQLDWIEVYVDSFSSTDGVFWNLAYVTSGTQPTPPTPAKWFNDTFNVDLSKWYDFDTIQTPPSKFVLDSNPSHPHHNSYTKSLISAEDDADIWSIPFTIPNGIFTASFWLFMPNGTKQVQFYLQDNSGNYLTDIFLELTGDGSGSIQYGVYVVDRPTGLNLSTVGTVDSVTDQWIQWVITILPTEVKVNCIIGISSIEIADFENVTLTQPLSVCEIYFSKVGTGYMNEVNIGLPIPIWNIDPSAWSAELDILAITSDTKDGKDCMKVTNKGDGGEITFATKEPLDLYDGNTIQLWWYGNNDGEYVDMYVYDKNSHLGCLPSFQDNFTGWTLFTFWKKGETYEETDWHNITEFCIGWQTSSPIWIRLLVNNNVVTHTFTITQPSAGGMIVLSPSPPDEVPEGAQIFCGINLDTGYKFDYWIIDGTADYTKKQTFAMMCDADHTIAVVLEAIPMPIFPIMADDYWAEYFTDSYNCTLEDDSTDKVHGINSGKITVEQGEISWDIANSNGFWNRTAQDTSGYDYISFWFKGTGRGQKCYIGIWDDSDWCTEVVAPFYDTSSGWREIIIKKTDFISPPESWGWIGCTLPDWTRIYGGEIFSAKFYEDGGDYTGGDTLWVDYLRFVTTPNISGGGGANVLEENQKFEESLGTFDSLSEEKKRAFLETRERLREKAENRLKSNQK
jgi:hypothetical protein